MVGKPQLTPQAELEIATYAAKGTPQREIAKQLGISPTTVNTKLKKAQVKALVERMGQELIARSAGLLVENHVLALQKAHKIQSRLANSESEEIEVGGEDDETEGAGKQAAKPKRRRKIRSEELSESEKVILALADKKEYRLGQMMGIFPSHAPSVLIQNIFQAGSAAVLLPNVAAALGQAGIQFQVEPEPAGDEEDGVIDVGDE